MQSLFFQNVQPSFFLLTYEWLWTQRVLIAAAVFKDLLHLYHLYMMLLEK